MRIYKKMIKISFVVAVGAFFLAIFMHYCFQCNETEFWINVCLGLFGSAALTVLTSIVSYWHERIKTLENFLYHTKQILSRVNKYQESMTLEQKLQFFIDYYEFDKIDWDCDMGNIDFFFEPITKDRKYIYYSIYKPLLDFNNAVAKHIWHFRWHLDGSGKNDEVIQSFVRELQGYLLKIEERKIPTEYDENGNVISFSNCKMLHPKLVCDIKNELMGRYYEVLYGKKVIRKARNENKAQENNKNEKNVFRRKKV